MTFLKNVLYGVALGLGGRIGWGLATWVIDLLARTTK
jgi:hypothetical protein